MILISTNFGCSKNCIYCTKKQNIKTQQANVIPFLSFRKVEKIIKEDPSDILFLGNLDPFYSLQENYTYIKKFIDIGKKYGKRIWAQTQINTTTSEKEFMLLSNLKIDTLITNMDYMDNSTKALNHLLKLKKHTKRLEIELTHWMNYNSEYLLYWYKFYTLFGDKLRIKKCTHPSFSNNNYQDNIKYLKKFSLDKLEYTNWNYSTIIQA